ncbi:hypothetical protein [Hymenobacter arcticus]
MSAYLSQQLSSCKYNYWPAWVRPLQPLVNLANLTLELIQLIIQALHFLG